MALERYSRETLRIYNLLKQQALEKQVPLEKTVKAVEVLSKGQLWIMALRAEAFQENK